jgi:hypothetical protein
MSEMSNRHVEVQVDLQDPDSLPESVGVALQQLAAALAEEEITLTDELVEAMQEESEVSGFSAGGTMALGDLSRGIIGSPIMGFCISKGKDSDGAPCGVYGRTPSDGEGPSDSCTVYWIR